MSLLLGSNMAAGPRQPLRERPGATPPGGGASTEIRVRFSAVEDPGRDVVKRPVPLC